MSVVWLILKMLLWIIGILLAMLMLVILLILVLPIDYLVELEKYEELSLYSKVKVFYVLSIIYYFENQQSNFEIKILGKTLNKKPVKTKEVEEVERPIKRDLAQDKEKIDKEMTKPSPKVAGTEGDKAKPIKKEEPIKEQNETREKESKSENVRGLWNDAKILWENKYRKPFLRRVKRLFISWWRALKPRTLQFNLTIGTGDPADTGELLAKASFLYPFYAKYGFIQGDFEEKGIWGVAVTSGRLRLYGLIKPLVVFLIDKSVRNYIKIILNIRKEEKNGV
ncbi:MAG: hypothetical protein RR324_05160 [Cellulosilyticaceae bacterium]